MKKNALVILGVIILVVFIPFPTYAESAANDTMMKKNWTIVGTRAANIEYRYKRVDGKIYRRLYDYTNQKWVGEWELCQ